jgi:hypothetical protein
MKYHKLPIFIGAAAMLGGLLIHGELSLAANFVGDAHDDLVIGAPGKSPGASPRSGAAFLFAGGGYSVSPIALLDQGGLAINEAGDRFGTAFAAGDFDGDGLEDLAIGAPGKTTAGGQRSGAVFIFTGSAGGLRAADKLDQTGLGHNQLGDRFGETMIAADFNGDGFDDLVVGAPGETFGTGKPAGAVYLFIGSPTGLLPMMPIDQSGLGLNEPGDLFGAALSAGDYDGDGRADLAVGAPGEAQPGEKSSGVVFLFRGAATGLKPDRVLDQKGLGTNEEGDLFGFALTSGDFNNDGRDDLAVGAPGEAPGTDPQSGAVFVFRGSPTGLRPRQFLSQKDFGHNELGDEFGYALTAGDFNGDGRDDLAIGTPGKMVGTNPNAGSVMVFRGDPTNLVYLQTLTQTGTGANEADDRFGEALSSGNYVGDYRIDLAVGAPGETVGTQPPSGAVYLFRGFSQALTGVTSIDQTGLALDEPGDLFGVALLD